MPRGGKATQSPGMWSPAPPTRQSTRNPTRTAPGEEAKATSRAYGQAATTMKDRGRAPLNTFREALGTIIGLYFFTYYHATYE